MSSLELAELTGKRHEHGMQDIRLMLEAIGGLLNSEDTGPSFGGSYRDSAGRTLPCFQLPYDETLMLVAGYDAALRFKIVRRWRELEQAKPVIAVPTTMSEALRLAADEHDWAIREEGLRQTAQAKVELQNLANVGELASGLAH